MSVSYMDVIGVPHNNSVDVFEERGSGTRKGKGIQDSKSVQSLCFEYRLLNE